MKILFITLLVFVASGYDRNGAVNYANQWWNGINHKCGNHESCNPCSYWGTEHCGYSGPAMGGDCANFVSQCLVKGGGHPKLNGGAPCRGYPCGFEEIGAANLGECLKKKGWQSSCGHQKGPPSNIKVGDVIVYHSDSCSGRGHAVIITQISGGSPKITCHSSERHNVDYTYIFGSKPYVQWLHYNG